MNSFHGWSAWLHGRPLRDPRELWFSELWVAVCVAPLALAHLGQLWARPHYQFFPMLLGAIGLLVWLRWPTRPKPAPAWVSLTALAPGVLAMAAAAALYSPWLGGAAAVVCFGALLIRRVGWRCFRHELLGVWALSLLLIPLPLGLDVAIVNGMRQFAAQGASASLEWLEVRHVLSGNVLETPSRPFFVAEACSGSQSVFALASLTTVWLVWKRRPVWRGPSLLAFAAVWAVAANIVRMTLVLLVHDRWGWDWASGWRHEVLGAALFAYAGLMVASSDRLLAVLEGAASWLVIRPVRRLWPDAFDGDGSDRPADEPQGESGLPSGLPAVIFGTLLVMSLLQWTAIASANAWGVVDATTAPALDDLAAPSDWTALQRERRRTEIAGEGSQSEVRRWTTPYGETLSSLDAPFYGWHELTKCYRDRGWELTERRLATVAPNSEPVVVARLSHPNGRFACLIFTLFDVHGQQLTAPAETPDAIERLRRRWGRGLWSRLPGGNSRPQSAVAARQFQLVAFSYTAHSEAQIDDLSRGFAHLLTQLTEPRRHAQ